MVALYRLGDQSVYATITSGNTITFCADRRCFGTVTATSATAFYPNTFDCYPTHDISSTSTSTTAGVFTWQDGTCIAGTFKVTGLVDYRALIRNQIKSNLLIKLKSRHADRDGFISPQELKARDTLRDMISEADWRRYLTNGFLMVKGSMGYWYQIFKNSGIIVYKDGKKIHYICIHTHNACPPTDHVLNMKLLIEIDEVTLWRNGNVRDCNFLTSDAITTISAPAHLNDILKQFKNAS